MQKVSIKKRIKKQTVSCSLRKDLIAAVSATAAENDITKSAVIEYCIITALFEPDIGGGE